MLRFKKDFPDASQILLGVNYRSTSNIVTNSLKVIMHNTRRYEKELKAERKGGPCLHIQEVKDVNEEAEYIAGEIEKASEAEQRQRTLRCFSGRIQMQDRL